MHSNLSPYLLDAMTRDAEQAVRRARRPRAQRWRLARPGFLRRRPRGGRTGRRVAPA